MNKGSTTVNKIAKFLREEITYSRLKSEQHLKEKEIANKFKVSRVPVREAFRILQSEGYIEVKPHKGSFVGKTSKELILEMSILYIILAPVILEKAIPRYTSQTYKKADAILKKVESCTDFSKIGYLLWKYAQVVYGPSKMKFLLGIFDDIYSHNIRLLNELFEFHKRKSYDTTPHRTFLLLCKQNKQAEAIKVWQDHIEKIQILTISGKK